MRKRAWTWAVWDMLSPLAALPGLLAANTTTKYPVILARFLDACPLGSAAMPGPTAQAHPLHRRAASSPGRCPVHPRDVMAELEDDNLVIRPTRRLSSSVP